MRIVNEELKIVLVIDDYVEDSHWWNFKVYDLEETYNEQREEPNEDDEQFIDDQQQPLRKRGREELSEAREDFIEKTQKMDDDDDANEALSLELEID